MFPLFDNADSYLLQSNQKSNALNLSIDLVKCITFDDVRLGVGGGGGGGGGENELKL